MRKSFQLLLIWGDAVTFSFCHRRLLLSYGKDQRVIPVPNGCISGYSSMVSVARPSCSEDIMRRLTSYSHYFIQGLISHMFNNKYTRYTSLPHTF